MGTIVHRDITRKESGRGRAELGVKTEWVTGAAQTILEESTTFTFEARPGVRIIDRVTLLRPTAAKVTFTDNKEGMLGLRVIRALEDPAEKGGEFVDAAGKVTKMPSTGLGRRDGRLHQQRGQDGREVWGTRGKWTMLGGTVDG